MKRLYIDIETRPGDTKPSPADIPPPGNYKDPAKIQAYQESKVDEEHRKQSLNSMQGQVLCIGFAWGEDEPDCVYDGECEENVLTMFENVVRPYSKQEVCWVGHNVRNFDLQWLWRKAVKYRLPNIAMMIPRYRYDKQVIDTGELWAGPDFKAYCKLDDIAKFLGIPGKNGFDGSMVYDAWFNGEHDKIMAYCMDDVRLVRDVYKAITFLDGNAKIDECPL